MLDCRALFEGKRITLFGLGILGRGVGDAEFLAQCGAKLTVTDRKSEAELAPSVERLRKFSNIEFHLGGHRLEDFTDTDLVIKAAGVPLDSPEIAAARAAGVEVAMSTALFAKYAREEGAVVVGVTGTRGKSTVTHLIFHALQEARRRSLLGGNIRGLSTLALLRDVQKGDVAVLELDSWQLQGFGYAELSPHIAVFTNLMPDHQNYYKDMNEYFADKANIFKFQKSDDVLIVGSQVIAEWEAAFAALETGAAIAKPDISKHWKTALLGAHNQENAALAAEALRALGLSEAEIERGLESFQPVEGRLQFVREIRGMKIYNDNNATTPEATIAALRALGDGVTLICGGSEKGLPLELLVAEIRQRAARVIVLMHSNYKGSERLAEGLRSAGVAFTEALSLEEALKAAVQEGRTILFSPAFASFGMFKNEYERNDEFLHLAEALS